jgi:hypothetical protein
MTKRSLVLASSVALLALLAAGCGGASSDSESTSTAAPPPVTPATVRLPAARVQFGSYATAPLLSADTPPYAGAPPPHSLDGVRIVRSIRETVGKPGVSAVLAKQGFAVVPSDLLLFHNAYEGNVYDGWPVFVTTDVAYHEWHLVFDKILRDAEQKVLLPKLETLARELVAAARAQTAETAGSGAEDAALRAEQLFQVAAAELGLPVKLGPLAEKEKALIDAHDSTEVSPIVGSRIDYSLFTPRGHYTRSAALTRYFKAMSVLGQSAFCLPGTKDCPGVEPARIGILASRLLVADPQLVGLWRDLYEPTAFLIGLADDYTPLEVAAAAKKALPKGLEDATAFAEDATVEKLLDRLARSRPIRIDPERAAVRVMGSRFVIDSFVLDQLLAPNVNGRLTPSALDLAAAFGSEFAYKALEQEGGTDYPNYDTQLEAMRKLIEARPAKEWGSTVYDAWLHALEPMFARHGKAFPDFMRSEAWTAKDHQTAFGSYAELKHDSILYAKQSFAEGGDSGVPARRNWVEPDPVAFARLAAVADLMRQGLDERGLLTNAQAKLLRDVIALDRFLERIARDELAGKAISKQDNDRLTYLGGELEALWWRTADLKPSPQAFPTNNAQDALIADISSSPKGVLEVATGRIDRIYVLVPDDDGTFQVAVGGVYSYYEFTTPPGERLTDEAWRAKLAAGQAPERPAWEEAFLAH